jgi:3,4-dihydroxy 2-butanone 4-phosphate synthase/GTP cyclohydrolase II
LQYRRNIGFACAQVGEIMTEDLKSNRATAGFTVKKEAEANLPTEFGQFRIIGFRSLVSDEEFVALVKGEIKSDRPTLVRIHSQCLTGDVFHSLKCDCGPQLERAMEMVQAEGGGVIVYQQQEGRGIGIINKIRAYALQDEGADTIEANLRLGFDIDHRRYDQCAEVIKLLGARRVRLMSNNPDKLRALQEAGLEVVERVPLEIRPKSQAFKYLIAKKEKMGHLLQLNGIF